MDPLQDAKNFTKNYQNSVENLMTELDAAASLAEIRILFSRFYLQYTMLPSLWMKWLELEERTAFPDFDASILPRQKQKIKSWAKTHFIHENFNNKNSWMVGIFDKRVHVSSDTFTNAAFLSQYNPSTAKPLEQGMTFPHFSLDWNKYVCKRYAKPLSLKLMQQFDESKKFMAQLDKDSTSESSMLCTRTFTKHPDKIYILNSFEYQLGKYPHLQQTWQIYIDFLSPFNSKLMLTACSRYCRLFVGKHDEIFGLYIQMTMALNILFHNVSVWWIDIVEFCRIFESDKTAKALLEKIQQIHSHHDDEIFVNYVEWFEKCPNKEGSPFVYSLPGLELLEVKSQMPRHNFRIKQKTTPALHHFNQQGTKADSRILQRLFESCKYFCIKQSARFCYRLGIFDECDSTFFEQSLFLNSASLDFEGLNGLIVTNLLQVNSPQIPTTASQILPKIDICSIRNLELCRQNLTELEFDSISGDKISGVSLANCQIMTLENEKLKVEQIIKKFPNAKRMDFDFDEDDFSEKTAKELSKMERIKNLAYFCLSNAPQTFGISFFAFVKKYAIPKAAIQIKFGFDVEDNYKIEFYANGNAILAGLNIDLEIS